MTKCVTKMVTEIVNELRENFLTFEDANVFLKANVEVLLEKASEPKNAPLIKMLGTPNIMKFFASCQKPVAATEEKPKKDEAP